MSATPTSRTWRRQCANSTPWLRCPSPGHADLVTSRLRGARRLGCSTAANTAAVAIASYRREATRLEHRPSRRPPLDGPGQSAHSYGSEGRGFESLRARPAHRPVARPAAGFLVALGATLGATRTYQLRNSARLIDSAAARLSPSSRCPYTSLVTAMLAWPSTSETTCSGVPWASIKVSASRAARS
jgi:hypothetical protein